jgi:AAA15 family ATPase/GTPase
LSNPNQPRLLSFTLIDSPILGDRITVTLTDGVAVLVGKNGAGKSAILEGFEAIASQAIGRSNLNRQNDKDSFPKELIIQVLTPTNRILQYQYKVLPVDIADRDLVMQDLNEESIEESQFLWEDQCQYIDQECEILWTTDNEKTTSWEKQGGEVISIIGGRNLTFSQGSFGIRNLKNITLSEEREWIFNTLNGVRLLGKDPVRQSHYRRRSTLATLNNLIKLASFDTTDILSRKLFRMGKTEELNELEFVCQRIGLANKIEVVKYFNEKIKDELEKEEYLAEVLFDGINIGLLSDGTLRVLSILVEIITASPGSTIIIEEPEMQIHPGMLSKLLNEIEAYSYGKNIILSTHSPQVVSRTSPEKINLVHRENGKTIIRKLAENEIENVYQYLNEEGSLGEWIYSGILDE